jgi:hypothetical protein
MRDVSTSSAYIDHQILLAISPMMGLETPAKIRDQEHHGLTGPTGRCGDGLVRRAGIEDMKTDTITEANRQSEVIVSNYTLIPWWEKACH